MLGHIARACKNVAVKDDQGRLETRVERKDLGIITRQRRDRTQQDKIVTAESAVSALRKVAEQRSAKAGERRKLKAEASGRQPLRKRYDHPVAVAQEGSDSGSLKDEVRNSLGEDDGLSELEDVLQAFPARNNSQQVVTIEGSVNGKKCTMIADTGASRALCNAQNTVTLQLKPVLNSRSRQLNGLRDLLGKLQKLVKVVIGSRERNVTFWVVGKPGLPMLLGREELARFNVLVDPVSSCLLDRESCEVVATSIEQHQGQQKDPPELDTLTQKKLGATDKELYEDGKKALINKLTHLSEDRRQQVWEAFDKFKAVWLRPRPGNAKYRARFKVEGPPVKHKMRRLTPELEREYIKQTEALEKAGVLEPSKSSWCSSAVFAPKKR